MRFATLVGYPATLLLSIKVNSHKRAMATEDERSARARTEVELRPDSRNTDVRITRKLAKKQIMFTINWLKFKKELIW